MTKLFHCRDKPAKCGGRHFSTDEEVKQGLLGYPIHIDNRHKITSESDESEILVMPGDKIQAPMNMDYESTVFLVIKLQIFYISNRADPIEERRIPDHDLTHVP